MPVWKHSLRFIVHISLSLGGLLIDLPITINEITGRLSSLNTYTKYLIESTQTRDVILSFRILAAASWGGQMVLSPIITVEKLRDAGLWYNYVTVFRVVGLTIQDMSNCPLENPINA